MNTLQHELRASALACRRGARDLFRGVHFSVHAGQWLHVRGRNGAGKTSLLRILCGLSRPHAGKVLWCGEELPHAQDTYRQALAYLGHHSGLKDELGALDNLRLAASLDGRALDAGTALDALARVGLRGREHLPLRYLSQGQRRRALMARVLARGASLWILDEPLAALDADGVDTLRELLAGHLRAGGSAVLTSHQPLALAGGQALEL